MTPELLELFQEYQRFHRAQAADERTSQQEKVTPPFSFQQVPEALSPEMQELVQQYPGGTNQSFESDMLKDISDVTEKLNQQLQERLPGGTTIPQQELPLPPVVETQRSFQQMLEVIQRRQATAQQAYQRAMEQYSHAWPSSGIPPREWIQKVQPFINKELVRQLADVRAEMSLENNSLAPRPLERSSSSFASPRSGSPSKLNSHSNAMVESLLKAFDTRSTSLIKAATSRKPKSAQSWWKSLRAKSKSQLLALNRELTRNSKEAARQRLSDSSSSLPRPGGSKLDGWSSTEGGGLASWVAGFLVVGVLGIALFGLRRWALGRENVESSRPLDASTIHDRHSFLRACHQLAWDLFGIQSHFWNHHQLFSRMAEAVDIEPQSLRQLECIYERARYAADGWSISDQDVRTARGILADIQDRTLVTP